MVEFWTLLPAGGWPRFACDAAWQSSLIGLLAWLGLRTLARAPAARAWVALLALGLCLALPLASAASRTAGYGWFSHAEGDGGGIASALPPVNIPPSPSSLLEHRAAQPVVEMPALSALQGTLSSDPLSVPSKTKAVERSGGVVEFVRTWFWTIVAGIWGAASFGLALRLFASLVVLRRLEREALPLPDPSIGAAVRRAARQLGIRREPQIAVSTDVASPTILAWRRPRLFIPRDCPRQSEQDWFAVFCHELAHALRGDGWGRLLAEVTSVALPWQAFVWYLRHEHCQACEEACDDWAVAAGTEAVALAETLADWIPRRPAAMALNVMGSAAGARRRISRLLALDGTPQPRLGRIWRAGGAALAIVLTTGLALAQQAAPRSNAEPQASRRGQESASEGPNGKVVPSTLAFLNGHPLHTITGTVRDAAGRPVSAAMVVAGSMEERHPQINTTGLDGRFRFQLGGQSSPSILAYKKGLAPASTFVSIQVLRDRTPIDLVLGICEPFVGLVRDPKGRPVPGASVIIEGMRGPGQDGPGAACNVPEVFIKGSLLERVFTTMTDENGRFQFPAAPAKASFILAVKAPGMADLRTMEHRGDEYLTGTIAAPATIVLSPAARVEGRVVTHLPGVNVSGLTIGLRGPRYLGSFWKEARTDDSGRFAMDGLREGTAAIFIFNPPRDAPWTFRTIRDAVLRPGQTTRVEIELIEGVLVEGRVVAAGSGRPVGGAQVHVSDSEEPGSVVPTPSATTDQDGRYRFRLPPGKTSFAFNGPVPGFALSWDTGRTVLIPAGVRRFNVPPIELTPAVTLHGRLVDARGRPIVGVKVVGSSDPLVGGTQNELFAVTDARGSFELAKARWGGSFRMNQPAHLGIHLRAGQVFEAGVFPSPTGAVLVRVPSAEFPNVKGPEHVAADELAGVVVDPAGRPLDGVDVDAWTWYPGNETRTDKNGIFRLGHLKKDRRIEVRFSKSGYAPQLFVQQPTGMRGWIVVLDVKTLFEGQVRGPDGKPVAGALIRANQGPKWSEGVVISAIWTEARSDVEGRYRMHAQSDVYDIQVRVPGVGVTRLQDVPLAPDEAKHLDVPLRPGIAFRAKAVDSQSGKPVAGVRLWDWQHPGIEGRSSSDGTLELKDMLPGRFEFQVEAPGYTRWWSEAAASEWNRRHISRSLGGWQRNFDNLDFDLKPGIQPATIVLERGVRIRGRVLDPDGKPRTGATVVPGLLGTGWLGYALTGDSRFDVVSRADGGFDMLLPASGAAEYNLTAHDGKIGEWREWANGISPPFRTRPGEEIREVVLRLTRPARVRGRVLDAKGHGVVGLSVRAKAVDKLENRFFDRTTSTDGEGAYELPFVRPGQQFIWPGPQAAPGGTSRMLELAPGELKDGVDLRVETAPEVSGRARAVD